MYRNSQDYQRISEYIIKSITKPFFSPNLYLIFHISMEEQLDFYTHIGFSPPELVPWKKVLLWFKGQGTGSPSYDTNVSLQKL